ncbi:MAG: hypothetical protein E6049_06535, partial [Varibaculum cambriense]|nr:hypothetical protein [Varibaculum cambriense]
VSAALMKRPLSRYAWRTGQTSIPTGGFTDGRMMWGSRSDKKFPWKMEVLEQLIPEISVDVCVGHQIQAYLSKSGYPLHPGFGGLAHWRGKELLDARHLLASQ